MNMSTKTKTNGKMNMSTETKTNIPMVTGVFRVSYSHAFKPEDPKNFGREDGEGKKVWSVTGIFEPNDSKLKDMKAMAKACGEAKWPGKKGWTINIRKGVEKDDENPKGFDLEKNPEYAGKVIIKMSSYGRPPKVVYNRIGADGKRVAIINEEDFYSGCYAQASVTCFAYSVSGNKGVSFGLSSLLKVRDGEPLGPVSDPTRDFAGIAEDEDDEAELDEDDL